MNVDIVGNLHKSFLASWSQETSSDPSNWSRKNAAWGQCAVTACYAQTILGGDIVRVTYETPGEGRGSHYFNILTSGEKIDFTIQQFPDGTIFNPPIYSDTQELKQVTREYINEKGYNCSTSEYILLHPSTENRYNILCSAIQNAQANYRG